MTRPGVHRLRPVSSPGEGERA